MMLLHCSRTLITSPFRVAFQSSLRKSSAICAESFKPVEVSNSKINLNLLPKRNYIRQNTGSRQRRKDGLPEGFELVYQSKYNLIYLCNVCVCYLTMGLTSWYVIKSYAFDNNEESKDIDILDMFTIPKADPAVTGVFVLFAVAAAVYLHCAFKIPRRMYVKNNELIAVTYSFLGPYTKKLAKCSLDEIRPLAPFKLMPWREMTYDLRGVRLYIFRKNFRFFVPNANLIGLNEPLRTRLNDIVDKVKEWITVLLRTKQKV